LDSNKALDSSKKGGNSARDDAAVDDLWTALKKRSFPGLTQAQQDWVDKHSGIQYVASDAQTNKRKSASLDSLKQASDTLKKSLDHLNKVADSSNKVADSSEKAAEASNKAVDTSLKEADTTNKVEDKPSKDDATVVLYQSARDVPEKRAFPAFTRVQQDWLDRHGGSIQYVPVKKDVSAEKVSVLKMCPGPECGNDQKSSESLEAPEKESDAPKKHLDAPKKEADAPKKEADAPIKEADVPKKEAVAPKKEADVPKKEADAPKKEADAPKKEADAPKKHLDAPIKESDALKKESDDAIRVLDASDIVKQASDTPKKSADSSTKFENAPSKDSAVDIWVAPKKRSFPDLTQEQQDWVNRHGGSLHYIPADAPKKETTADAPKKETVADAPKKETAADAASKKKPVDDKADVAENRAFPGLTQEQQDWVNRHGGSIEYRHPVESSDVPAAPKKQEFPGLTRAQQDWVDRHGGSIHYMPQKRSAV
jgi:hypothetical protein